MTKTEYDLAIAKINRPWVKEVITCQKTCYIDLTCRDTNSLGLKCLRCETEVKRKLVVLCMDNSQEVYEAAAYLLGGPVTHAHAFKIMDPHIFYLT